MNLQYNKDIKYEVVMCVLIPKENMDICNTEFSIVSALPEPSEMIDYNDIDDYQESGKWIWVRWPLDEYYYKARVNSVTSKPIFSIK